jgi:hypothetical protein
MFSYTPICAGLRVLHGNLLVLFPYIHVLAGEWIAEDVKAKSVSEAAVTASRLGKDDGGRQVTFGTCY